MRVYDGELKLIGEGIVQSNGSTKVSVIEIGNHVLRNIILTRYISTYLRNSIGQHVKILVSTGLSQGIITRPFIIAAEVNNKKYKEGAGQLLFMNFVKALFYCGLAVLIYVFSESLALPLIIAILAIGYYLKEFFDFVKFG